MELDLGHPDFEQSDRRIVRPSEQIQLRTRSDFIIANEVLPPENPRPRKLDRLIAAREEIEKESAWKTDNVGYICRSLVQATLPYREPKDNPPAWGRTNGRVSLLIQPGMSMVTKEVVGPKGVTYVPTPTSIGYPYGAIPRLLLAWIGKEVKMHGKRDIEIGKSLTQFMAEIGLNSATGGKTGSITRLKDQIRRLFSCKITITDNLDSLSPVFKNDSFNIADKTMIWWDRDNEKIDQKDMFPSFISLSEKFFEELSDSPVPLDMRALKELKSSPTALDLYSFLTWKFFSLNHDQVLEWSTLKGQFGADIRDPAKFKHQFTKALDSVLEVYKEANVISTKEGLVLKKSRTSVPQRVITKA